jgi:diguanylate cyclase (GGDEF)-like protein/PAS domain S-box-containing protein
MSMTFTPHVLPFAIAALVLAALIPVAWSNRRDPVARWFAWTLMAFIVWAVGYIFELLAVELDSKILFANLQFLGVATVSVCWWEMTRRYLGLSNVPKALTAFLWIVAGATVVIAFTNPGSLFRGQPLIETGSAPIPVLHADYGPWYMYVLLPMTALLNVAVLALLGSRALRSHRLYRKQYLVLFVALLVPLAATLLYVTGLPPVRDYNLTPAVAGISGLLLAVGVFRWSLFDIVPFARDLVVDDLADGVIVADKAGRIVDLNASAERLTQLKHDEVVGRQAEEVLEHYPVLTEILAAPDDGPSHTIGRREMVIKLDDVNRYYGVSSSRVMSHRGRFLGRAVVLHEVTERVKLVEQVRELANSDDLTGLCNRRHFLELAGREFERARRHDYPVSLVMFDVDHFKEVNDTYGHRAGDLVLRELALKCRSVLRSTDVVGRLGGEEFAVLLSHANLKGAAQTADRIRQAVESMRVGGGTHGDGIMITISVGVTQLAADAMAPPDTLDLVLERADKALYQAKGAGRNSVVTSEGETVPPAAATASLRVVV